jgi:HEAT repeat protein
MSQSDWAQLLQDLYNIADIDRAVKASLALAEVANETHTLELYKLLQDESFFIREAAAVPLARLEGIKALPALFQAFTRGIQDGYDNDGLNATIADLLESHQKEATPILLKMLTETDDEIRANAAWALGFVASEITAEPLMYALNNDESSKVRSAAAGSLGSFSGNPKVVDELVKAIKDKDEQVRISVISSLGYLGDRRGIPPLQEVLKGSSERIGEFVRYALQQLNAL